jgi:predicted amidohydrolase
VAASDFTVVAVQTGPAADDVACTVEQAFALAEESGREPDLIVFPELFSRPFWCVGTHDPAHFEWAEDVDGQTVTAAARLAKAMSSTVVAPFFERGAVAGEFYNSAAVVGPDGALIQGTLPDGSTVETYRKNAISSYRWGEAINDEKFYFRPGPGFAVFDSPKARIGILICLDRWFPEAWRVLALAGAEVVCVVNASAGPVSDLFQASMRTCAAQNVVSAIAVNKAGSETYRGTRTDYYGQSCIIDPYGTIVAGAAGEPVALSATLDLSQRLSARQERTMYRDRRPELYSSITDVT